jgi:sulfatase maturation enzyme AslB (radical SAM superfamily)
MRHPTVEWQVCGVCNYDCSYCIQSRKYRVGHPSREEVERFLDFFAELPGRWEIKMTGGEPFAFKDYLGRILPQLVERTPHTLSTLTNLSAPLRQLRRFAELTRGRLGIVSASLHLEFTPLEEFLEKAVALRQWMDPQARMVINSVLVPERLKELHRVKRQLAEAGLKLFPQWLKVKNSRHTYTSEEMREVELLVGPDPGPREANLAPNYQGRTCWTGVDYLVILQNGEVWSCRTARRHGEGYLGNVLQGTVQRWQQPRPCPYTLCPCTVPANRGMIEGVGAGV